VTRHATRSVMIENRRGLHARASMAFVTLATGQPVELTVEKDGASARALRSST
jgi:phosphocarrier protein HPr